VDVAFTPAIFTFLSKEVLFELKYTCFTGLIVRVQLHLRLIYSWLSFTSWQNSNVA